MKQSKNPLTDFGVEVHTWCLKNNISHKELAELAGVKSDTLTKAIRGRRPGHETVRKVREYIANYGDVA